MSGATDLTGLATAIERVIEGSPVIVAVLLLGGFLLWRAWREDRAQALQDRREWLAELREERDARATSHKETILVMERIAVRSDESISKATQGLHAVEAALIELRHAIKDKTY